MILPPAMHRCDIRVTLKQNYIIASTALSIITITFMNLKAAFFNSFQTTRNHFWFSFQNREAAAQNQCCLVYVQNVFFGIRSLVDQPRHIH